MFENCDYLHTGSNESEDVVKFAHTEYLLLFFGFLATAIGVRGNTWDESKAGWRKLTVIGWIAISIALFATAISAYIYFLSQVKADLEQQTALYTMISDFKSFERMPLYVEHGQTLPEDEYDSFLNKLDKVYNSNFENYKIHVLLYSKSLSDSDKIDVEHILSSAQGLRDSYPEFKDGVIIRLRMFADIVGEIRKRMCKSITVPDWKSDACDEVTLRTF